MKTIKSSSDISYIFEHGRRIGTPDVNFIIARSMEQHDLDGRVAFIAGKKLGNSVWRNRAKRRMRDLCRRLGAPYPGYDILFLARRSVNDTPFEKVESNARKALSKHNMPVTSKV